MCHEQFGRTVEEFCGQVFEGAVAGGISGNQWSITMRGTFCVVPDIAFALRSTSYYHDSSSYLRRTDVN
jgi:hypothetical protein